MSKKRHAAPSSAVTLPGTARTSLARDAAAVDEVTTTAEDKNAYSLP